MIFNLKYTKREIVASGILLASFIAFVTLLSLKTPVYACSGTCPTGCYTSPSCGCTGPGGCVYRATCYSSEFKCGTDMCCDICDGSCGSCSCTPTACSGYYSVTSSNGCSSTTYTCTKYYTDPCCGSCGTASRTCWLVKYTLTYTANSHGSISGTTPQSICRGSNGSAVTAVPDTGYHFTSWSDSSTANPRTDTSVTANLSVSASFEIDNLNPTAPTDLLAEGVATPTNVSDVTPEFSAIFNDPDTSDTGDYYQIQVNTASDFSGTSMWDSGLTSMTSTANGSRSSDISYNGTTLPFDGSTFYWRIKFGDDKGGTSPWSSVSSFTMNTAPTAPTTLLAEGVSTPTGVSDTTPEFSAIFNDPNSSDTGTYYQIQVNTASDFSGTSMWDSGLTSMTSTSNGSRSPDISYAGTTLPLDGTTYYWRIRFADNLGTTGAWSTTSNFTMNIYPSAPTSLLTEGQTNPVSITDTTPEFSAIFNDPEASDTGERYQIQVNTASDFSGTSMWDSGLTSMTSTANGSRSPDISYAGTTLPLDGTTYYWRIRFANSYGTAETWSTTANFTMNNVPTAPTALLSEGATNPTNVTDITPEFSAVFNDPDTPDTANYYQIQVNTASDFSGTTMWDSTKTALSPVVTHGARSQDISYAGTTIALDGTTYYWRIKFWDNSNNEGPWSDTATFLVSGDPYAPTSLQTNNQTNPSVLTNVPPYFSAIYSDMNGNAASAYQINVNTSSDFLGTSMWDSGKTSTTVTNNQRSSAYQYAGTDMSNSDTTYYWRIRFWDSDDRVSPWSETAQFTDTYSAFQLGGLGLNGVKLD